MPDRFGDPFENRRQIAWWGGQSLAAGGLTVGQLVAIVVLLGFLESPVSRLTYLGGEVQRVAAAAARLERLTGADVLAQAAGALPLPPRGHRVCYEAVEFRYREGEAPALREPALPPESGLTACARCG